jgi:HD-GYP domain-containing protein (c-di-GMP phosphodiesterase class II)
VPEVIGTTSSAAARAVAPLAAARALAPLAVAAERAGEDTWGLFGVTEVLATLVDERDASSALHSRAVARLCRHIALEMGCSEQETRMIAVAGRLHDIGKVVVPAEILDKPGPLTAAEWRIVRLHPGAGAEIVGLIESLRPTLPLIRAHHERFDGTGYPDGLAGSEIPLGARIIAAADAYNAMISDRPYRAQLSGRQALLELERCTGKHFDPAVVVALTRVTPLPSFNLLAA